MNLYTIQLYIYCLIDTLRMNRGGTLVTGDSRTKPFRTPLFLQISIFVANSLDRTNKIIYYV